MIRAEHLTIYRGTHDEHHAVVVVRGWLVSWPEQKPCTLWIARIDHVFEGQTMDQCFKQWQIVRDYRFPKSHSFRGVDFRVEATPEQRATRRAAV